jgi:cytochrome c553
LLCATAALALAADLAAGCARVQSVCAASHGANSFSVSDSIANLVGQAVAYLERWLRALKDGSRKNDVMGAMAS